MNTGSHFLPQPTRTDARLDVYGPAGRGHLQQLHSRGFASQLSGDEQVFSKAAIVFRVRAEQERHGVAFGRVLPQHSSSSHGISPPNHAVIDTRLQSKGSSSYTFTATQDEELAPTFSLRLSVTSRLIEALYVSQGLLVVA